MKKVATLVSLLLLFNLASCAAGPQQLSRSVDAWDHELYVDSLWEDDATFLKKSE